MGETSGRAIGKVFGRGAKMTQGVGQRQGDGAKSNFFWQGGMQWPQGTRKAIRSGGEWVRRDRPFWGPLFWCLVARLQGESSRSQKAPRHCERWTRRLSGVTL